jgi:hypothetical protein
MKYKYLPIERLSYLDNELLRFTQPTDLNDPFECLPQRPSKQEFLTMIDDVMDLMLKNKTPIARICNPCQ